MIRQQIRDGAIHPHGRLPAVIFSHIRAGDLVILSHKLGGDPVDRGLHPIPISVVHELRDSVSAGMPVCLAVVAVVVADGVHAGRLLYSFGKVQR